MNDEPDDIQRYPAWRFHPTKPACIVQDEVEDQGLGDGWFDSPTKAEEALSASAVKAAKPPVKAVSKPKPKPKGKPAPKPTPKPEEQPVADVDLTPKT